MRTVVLTAATAASASICAAAITPYASDANTVVLYHFNESSGAFVNGGTGGTTLDLTNTGGVNGRDNDTDVTHTNPAATTHPFTPGGGYGATSYTGFSNAFNPLKAGDGAVHTTSSAPNPNTGGGALTASTSITQSALLGADGAFTFEAIVKLNSLNNEQTIISHDNGETNNANRGFNFGIVQDSGVAKLRLGGARKNTATANVSTANWILLAVPQTGTHAWSSDAWFHVAVTYTGEENTAGNLKLFWTRLGTSVTEANLLGSANLLTDLATHKNRTLVTDPLVDITGYVGVGTHTRAVNRLELDGLVDEVRLSNVARASTDFLVVVPEPASLSMLGLAGMGLLRRRRA